MPGSNNLIKTGGGCTLAHYNGGNAFAVRDYDDKNCDIYVNGAYASVYSYQITANGNVKTLRNLSLKIYDLSGKLVYETKTTDRNMKIDQQFSER